MRGTFIVLWYYNAARTDFIAAGPFATFATAQAWATGRHKIVGTFEVVGLTHPNKAVGHGRTEF